MRTLTAPGNADRSALLVSGSPRSGEQMKSLLEGTGCDLSGLALSGGEARRALLSSGAGLLIVNAPLPDEFGHDLACDAAERGICSLLLVKAEMLDSVRSKVSPSGVLTLGKPLSRERFHEALALLEVFRSQLEKKESESRRLRAKLEEVKLVCRAKCLLVEYRKLTEPEAHRYLEKEAMDRRLTLRAVAEEILSELGDGRS